MWLYQIDRIYPPSYLGISLSPSADKYVNHAGVSLVKEGTQRPGVGFKALLVLNEGNNFSLKIGKPTLQGVLDFFSKVFKIFFFKEKKSTLPQYVLI